ncbi:hypothetical protein M885DRAFT_527597 [Pelagophyceae sp. CCMP2097]|nr:hypothetical protein M885DRAFT_527597 [Pelagophyceae sp. CCMP2097]
MPAWLEVSPAGSPLQHAGSPRRLAASPTRLAASPTRLGRPRSAALPNVARSHAAEAARPRTTGNAEDARRPRTASVGSAEDARRDGSPVLAALPAANRTLKLRLLQKEAELLALDSFKLLALRTDLEERETAARLESAVAERDRLGAADARLEDHAVVADGLRRQITADHAHVFVLAAGTRTLAADLLRHRHWLNDAVIDNDSEAALIQNQCSTLERCIAEERAGLRNTDALVDLRQADAAALRQRVAVCGASNDAAAATAAQQQRRIAAWRSGLGQMQLLREEFAARLDGASEKSVRGGAAKTFSETADAFSDDDESIAAVESHVRDLARRLGDVDAAARDMARDALGAEARCREGQATLDGLAAAVSAADAALAAAVLEAAAAQCEAKRLEAQVLSAELGNMAREALLRDLGAAAQRLDAELAAIGAAADAAAALAETIAHLSADVDAKRRRRTNLELKARQLDDAVMADEEGRSL